MKKVINITIGKIVFFIEEDAYAKLSAYLEAVREHFKSEPGFVEIMEDIENGIAEKFLTRTNEKKNSISLPHVEDVIKEMGKVKDFEEFENASYTAPSVKRFYRDGENTIIAGVASGIAAYLGIDPTIVRLIFAFSVFFGGFGIFLYIVLWLITPLATTTVEKLEMRGEPVNLSNIKDFVEDKFGPEGKVRAKGFFDKAFTIVGRVIKILAQAVVKIAGVVLVAAGVAAIVGLVFAFSNLIWNIDSPYIDIPIREIFTGVGHVLPLLVFFFSLAIPFAFLALVGASLVRFRQKINTTVLIGMLAVWFLSLTFSGVYAIRIAPELEEKINAAENISRVERAYDLAQFDSVSIDGLQNIEILPGAEFSIIAQGKANVLDRTSVTLEENVLTIKEKRERKTCFVCFLSGGSTNFVITMPSLTRYEADGVVSAEIKGFEGGDMTLVLDGVSKTYLSGSADTLYAELDGVTKFEAEDFEVKNMEIKIDGPSRAVVSVVDTLKATIKGPGSLRYKGDPEITKEVHGPGSVRKITE